MQGQSRQVKTVPVQYDATMSTFLAFKLPRLEIHKVARKKGIVAYPLANRSGFRTEYPGFSLPLLIRVMNESSLLLPSL